MLCIVVELYHQHAHALAAILCCVEVYVASSRYLKASKDEGGLPKHGESEKV